MAGCLPDIEALAPDDLKGLVLQLLEDVVALKAENAALREEIARLKGLKGTNRAACRFAHHAQTRHRAQVRYPGSG